MTAIQITDIRVLNNPCNFLEPFQFEITFEASQQLKEDLEWRLTYVGSADSETCDQILDSVLVGPIPLGINRFVFEAPAPDPEKIPKDDLLGVTVVLLECLYRDKVFVRVGYYVSNEDQENPFVTDAEIDGNSRMTADEEIDNQMEVESLKSDSDGEGDDDGDDDMKDDNSKAPGPLQKKSIDIPPSRIRRYILENKPRVTKFASDWDNPSSSNGTV